eukprot:TRINITY_DN7878_c0_g2_i12.p1 TRINITY_DN7878_c0_g2~~TRINITY_DN7878_c0_g2_i12.p1  ORF type:complete len:150 (-),score=14.07 TRINITY_DN7878_c0_g2_i12:58-507(-)
MRTPNHDRNFDLLFNKKIDTFFLSVFQLAMTEILIEYYSTFNLLVFACRALQLGCIVHEKLLGMDNTVGPNPRLFTNSTFIIVLHLVVVELQILRFGSFPIVLVFLGNASQGDLYHVLVMDFILVVLFQLSFAKSVQPGSPENGAPSVV